MVIQGVTYLSDFEAKKAIMEMARRLEAKGWLVAGDGSMSVRVGPQAVWVTVAGADKAALTQDMLVRVDMNGKAMLSAKPKPLPEDLPIHLKIYQENENAQCVMHTYPACAAVMGMQGQTVQPAAFSPAVRALGRVQLLPAQNVDAQAQAVSLLCRTDKAVLLENDGCLTWGKTPADAAHSGGSTGLLRSRHRKAGLRRLLQMRQLRRSLHRLQQVQRTCCAAHGSARCTACGNGSTLRTACPAGEPAGRYRADPAGHGAAHPAQTAGGSCPCPGARRTACGSPCNGSGPGRTEVRKCPRCRNGRGHPPDAEELSITKSFV